MSYSFSVSGSRSEVIKKVQAKLEETSVSQPCHKVDKDQALAAVVAFVGVLPESDKEVLVSVNGSVGWSGGSGEDPSLIISAGVGVSVSFVG